MTIGETRAGSRPHMTACSKRISINSSTHYCKTRSIACWQTHHPPETASQASSNLPARFLPRRHCPFLLTSPDGTPRSITSSSVARAQPLLSTSTVAPMSPSSTTRILPLLPMLMLKHRTATTCPFSTSLRRTSAMSGTKDRASWS